MRERIHKNKKYLSLFYDTAELLIDNFADDAELGAIIRAAIIYELTGEKAELSDRALQIQLNNLCKEIDLSSKAADEKSDKQRKKIQEYWDRKKEPREMTQEEIDADIDARFPLHKGWNTTEYK